MLILELASNITLRLFLRPFEAVLSLKSLFERVPGGLQGSYFVWRAKMRNYYHLESSLEAVRPILKSEAARGRSSDLEPPRGQIWHPEVRASHLSIIYGGLGGSRSLERPRAASDFKIGRTAQPSMYTKIYAAIHHACKYARKCIYGHMDECVRESS